MSRKYQVSDSRVIIIASEGSNTERMYFGYLRKHLRESRIIIIPSKGGKTSPKSILENMNRYVKENQIQDDDLCYLVVDRDNWPSEAMEDITGECQKKGYHLIVSNPCFELWLMLHFISMRKFLSLKKINEFSTKKCQEFLIKTKVYKKKGKKIKNPEKYIDNLNTANKNARKIEINPNIIIPQNVATRVYLIIEKILEFTT